MASLGEQKEYDKNFKFLTSEVLLQSLPRSQYEWGRATCCVWRIWL